MNMVELQKPLPCILVASHDEWVGRSVESVVAQNGYTVLRVENGRRALALTRTARPDALILDSSLTELGGIEVCSALRHDPLFDPSTPIFITSRAPVSNNIRTSAYEAGAWDFCAHPLDVGSILLKLRTFLRAKREVATKRDSLLIDSLTGIYSENGLRQWADQLGARAARNHEPFACIALSTASSGPEWPPNDADVSAVAGICISESRKSDIVALVRGNRFTILAPDTDDAGARGFVGRLQLAMDRGTVAEGEVFTRRPLKAGFCALTDFGAAKVAPAEVVNRAAIALQFALRGSGRSSPVSFDELP